MAIFIVPAIILGCSGGGVNQTMPDTPPVDNPPSVPELKSAATDAETGRGLFGMWDICFDPETRNIDAIPVRNAQPHYNITNMLLPPICDDCIKISLNYFDPVSRVYEVNVTLKNPYPIAGRDVRGILYTNDAGHRLLNPDAWTPLYDIPGGEDINPFRAFAKDKVRRTFTGLQSHSENFALYLPKPPQFGAIRFAADGCWIGNCGEPYAIENFAQIGDLGDYIGATAILEVDVYDWQHNITEVALVSPDIAGEPFPQFEYVENNRWRLEVVNSVGAESGLYAVRIKATSPSPSGTSLYQYGNITVSPVPPVVAGIDPDSAPAASTVSGATVSGNSFQGPGATVKLLKSGAPDINAANVTVIDGTTITCDISIPLTAPLGLYDLEVVNGNGLSDIGTGLFEVLCPIPVVSGIDPDTAPIDGALTGVTVTGDSFLGPAVEVKLKRAGQPDISATNEAVVDPQTITCDITIPVDAAAGAYDVEVTNYCGASGAGAGLFTIFCPAPVADSIVPNKGDVDVSLTGVVISGTGFVGDTADVILKKDGAPDITASNIVVVDSNTINCDIYIPLEAAIGLYDLEITNSCGAMYAVQDIFEVICPEPVPTGCSVISADAGGGISGFEIYGADFKGPTMGVILKKASCTDIIADNIVVVDSSTITCDVSIPLTAAIGIYNIEATNGCGTTGTGYGLFEVTCPAPAVTAIMPNNWASYPPNMINDATISGNNFIPGGGVSQVYIDNGSVQINASDIAVLSNNACTCDFNIGAYPYAEGPYDLIVVTCAQGVGENLFTVYENLLFKQNFADGDGGCTGIGTHGGYAYCDPWWDSYSPCDTPYPISMYAAFMTPAFDIPAEASDVHFRMIHSIDADILEGCFAGWTNDDGATIFGDVCDSSDYWRFEAGQSYNGNDIYSPIYEGMGVYIGCPQYDGWTNRYWRLTFGSPGGTVWSQFHCTGSASLIGMNNARFMVVFLSDIYVESHRGHEIADLIVWYDPP